MPDDNISQVESFCNFEGLRPLSAVNNRPCCISGDVGCLFEINLDAIFDMDLESAMQTLMKIKGVGPKVASCVLLFGFSKYDAFPIDVWVKKILANYYSAGIPSHLSGKHAGIAQQYLFYYERCKNNVYL